MVAGGIPTVQVLLDDGTGTFPYDITTKTRVAYRVTRGRQDELAQVNPGDLALTLENDDGRFTLGSTTIASPSPIKVDQKIRIKDTPGGNLIGSADAGSFESSIGGWAFNTLLGARTAGTSVAQSAVRATDGTQSLLATWSTTATGNFVGVAVPTVIGLTYTFAADVYVPTGSPNVRVSAAFIANSAFTSTKDAWVRLSVTFVATATTTIVGIDQVAATAGQTCFIDSAGLSLGSTALPFAAGGLTVNRFTGYVQQWPVEWPSGSDLESTVVVTATDAQARGERWPLKSVIEQELTVDAALACFPLSEPTGSTVAVDAVATIGATAVLDNGIPAMTFGVATGPAGDGMTAAAMNLGQALVMTVPGGFKSFECTALRNGVPAQYEFLLQVPSGDLAVGFVPGTGAVFVLYRNNVLGTTQFDSGTNYCNNTTHDIRVETDNAGVINLYVDGVLKGSAADARPQTYDSTAIVGFFLGTLAYVTFGPGVLTAARALAHAQAVLTRFVGESGTARMTRAAGYASLPIGTLDASLTNMASVDTNGKSVSEVVREAADAEFGLVFFDGSGNLTFHNRNRVVSKLAPDLTLTADVLDPGTAFVVDMQGVLNYYEVTATPTNITQRARSTTSETTHGRYAGSASYVVQTDQEALDRGKWIIFTHAEPSPRVGNLVIDTMVLDAATQAALLACEPDTWIRITSLPSQTPGGTTADFIVQGFADTLAVDSWSLAFNVANKAVAAPTPWILDNATFSVLDSTTRIYV